MSTENECAASKQPTFFDTEAASEPVAASSPTVAESSSVAVAPEASVSADSTPQVGIEEIFFYIICTENKSKYWKINKKNTFFLQDQVLKSRKNWTTFIKEQALKLRKKITFFRKDQSS